MHKIHCRQQACECVGPSVSLYVCVIRNCYSPFRYFIVSPAVQAAISAACLQAVNQPASEPAIQCPASQLGMQIWHWLRIMNFPWIFVFNSHVAAGWRMQQCKKSATFKW